MLWKLHEPGTKHEKIPPWNSALPDQQSANAAVRSQIHKAARAVGLGIYTSV